MKVPSGFLILTELGNSKISQNFLTQGPAATTNWVHSIVPSDVSTAVTAPLPFEEIKLFASTPSMTLAPDETANL